LNKSYVSYEEFQDGADSTGYVFFDNLYATIHNVDNTSYSISGETQLTAKGSFMGQGDIRVKAVCPWNKERKNTIKGAIENFKMSSINTILEPVAQIRVESGYLHSLDFQFAYNDKHAQGEIALNYNDLKLTTFKEVNSKKNDKESEADDEEPEMKKDGLKSFILNAFIIRKNMDEKVPEEKRTGIISFNRDPRKSVFNYWWKSVFSGVKSAYHIDKLEERKAKKMLRKKNKD
jgi:hypothetical protein